MPGRAEGKIWESIATKAKAFRICLYTKTKITNKKTIKAPLIPGHIFDEGWRSIGGSGIAFIEGMPISP